MIARVAFPDRWARSWIALKIDRCQASGTSTRGRPSDVSHTTRLLTPGKQTFSRWSEEAGSSAMGHWYRTRSDRCTLESVWAMEFTVADHCFLSFDIADHLTYIGRSVPEAGWKRRVAVARRCFINSKADVISSVHASCQGAPMRASVSGCNVFAMLGRNLR